MVFFFFELVGDGFDEGTPRESRERLHHLSHHETGIDSLSVLQQKLQLPDADLWDFNKSEPGRGVRSPPIPDPTALSV